jgi:hypothetical protein
MTPYMIVGSLQTHAVKILVEGGVSPCIGTTDLGLPKVIEICDSITDFPVQETRREE